MDSVHPKSDEEPSASGWVLWMLVDLGCIWQGKRCSALGSDDFRPPQLPTDSETMLLVESS